MIICERCGKQLPDIAAICPSCGTISEISRPSSIGYESGQPSSISYEYSRGYGQQQIYASESEEQASRLGPAAQSNRPPQPVYRQPSTPPPAFYPPIAVNINVVAPVPVVAEKTNSGAIVVEVLLNLFLGIYGVGWMMAGETTTGLILLIASLVLYWPVVILGSIFTLGLGLLCLIPVAIGGVILNAVLLSNLLKRKATYIMLPTQVSAQPFPRR
jgi:hypothetical protein